MTGRIVVIPSSTVVRPDDRGLLYGDGVFETLHLRPDGPWLLDAHLARMATSADLLDLPLPPRDELVALAYEAAEAWGEDEGALRLICTRGPLDGPPSCYAIVSAVPDAALRERRDGIRLITADLGVSALRRPSWSLSTAKSLSYAANLAARRWAAGQNADDVLWVSTEGYALEAPTASLVWLAGDTVCTVPAQGTGILLGLTVSELLATVGEVGLRADLRMITATDLPSVDALWLASSLRGLAEVRTLDGITRQPSPWTPRLLALLGFANT